MPQLSTKQSKTRTSSRLQAILDEADRIKKQLRQETLSHKEMSQKYLGKKGLFTKLSKKILNLKTEEKPRAGKIINHLKDDITQYLDKFQSGAELCRSSSNTDLTLPGKTSSVGHTHLISQAIKEITQIFQKIGFVRARYPEVDWSWYAFGSLNMPPGHPARDEWETFFVNQQSHSKMGKMVLTPHTSNGQVREMERVLKNNGKPPIRMINIARCYRRQQDVTHTQMFHQFEGLVIDKGINIQHLKGTIDYFAKEFYGPNATSRIRPFHFKFTEPSFEVDFSCHICGGTGWVDQSSHTKSHQKNNKDDKERNQKQTKKHNQKGKEKCRFCKSGWHEVGGAGMVHPNVLKAGGIDPDKYTGFAFGWGVERTYTLRDGLDIDDIRLIYSSDLEFLQQF